MELCKVKGKRLVHGVIELPTFENKFLLTTGLKGVVYGTNFGMIFSVKEFKGKESDITCKKCLATLQS